MSAAAVAHTAFGTITPSSNLVVERVTQAILRDYPKVSAHYARTPHAGSVDPHPTSYHWDGMLGAARLLADARLDLICWNGTKGGSIGFERDRELCQRISAATGAVSFTSTLVLDEIFRARGITRIGFVTPYRPEYHARVEQVWAREGYRCVPGAFAGLADNYDYSTLDAGRIAAMTREVARSAPEAIVYYCTNMAGAPLCVALQAETGISIYDSVSATVWKCLAHLGENTQSGAAWGAPFTSRQGE